MSLTAQTSSRGSRMSFGSGVSQDQMGYYSIISMIFHALAFFIVAVGLPLSADEDLIMPAPITVEVVELSEITATDRVGKPIKKQPQADVTPTPPKAVPKQAPTVTSSTPVAPQPPKLIEKPATQREPDPPKQEAAQESLAPDAAPAPRIKPKIKPEKQVEEDFQSVLRNLAKAEPQPSEQDADDLNSDLKSQPKPSMMAPMADTLTVSEQDALRRQLEQCWNVPIGAKDVENMVIELAITMNQDRTVQSVQVADRMRYNRDQFFRAVADSAVRAIRNPRCSPLRVPPDKFNEWKSMVIRFNPKDMF